MTLPQTVEYLGSQLTPAGNESHLLSVNGDEYYFMNYQGIVYQGTALYNVGSYQTIYRVPEYIELNIENPYESVKKLITLTMLQ